MISGQQRRVRTTRVRRLAAFTCAALMTLAFVAPAANVAPPIPAPLLEQGRPVTFAHLTPDDGLSQSVVADIVQDRLGFMWFATQDGLNRFDGYTFKVFKHDPQDAHSLGNNFIVALDQDASGALWIGTNNGGLDRYDPLTGVFTHYRNDPADPYSLSEDATTYVYVDRAGRVWVGTPNSGLCVLDPQSGRFTRYQNDPADDGSLSANGISSIVEAPDGTLWVASFTGGLNRLDPGAARFTRYANQPEEPRSLSSNTVQSVYVDRQGVVWVGTTDAGLNRYDAATNDFTRYPAAPEDPRGLSHAWVYSLYEDRAGRFWVGTHGGGLHQLDRQSGLFTRYRHNANDPASLGNEHVWSIYEDQAGMLWFGTFGGGVDRYDPLAAKFLLLRSKPGDDQSLSSNQVWGLYRDPRGYLWIGTSSGELNRLDLTSGEWRRYVLPAPDMLFAIYPDGADTLWIGASTAVYRFDIRGERFEPVSALPSAFTFFQDSRGRFWVGSLTGLFLYDRATGAAQAYVHDPDNPASLSSNAISLLAEDAQGNLWVGTLSGGLNYFDPAAERFTHYGNDPADPASLSDNAIVALHAQPDGTLWVGTASGLNHFDPATGRAEIYREKDGLPNDVVYAIQEDAQGSFWLSTNRGIARFDPRTRAFKNYDKSDGLQDNEFNQSSAAQDGEGVLYFGGVNGLTIFHPDQVRDNAYVPPVVITAFSIRHTPVIAGANSPLRQPVEATRAIELSPNEGFFEFEFAALHYSAPEENQYAYRLEGLEDEWQYVGGRHYANYTNVPPGAYTFRVKGANRDGVWNEQGASLQIVIPPPFWQTTWFRVLVAVAVIGSVYGAVSLRIRAIEAQRRRLEGLVAERTHELSAANTALAHARDAAEAASRAKSAFLANMSHEFRTPLNAVLGFVQVLARDERLQTDQRDNLAIIHRSGEHLLGLINDVLELSKIEAGRTLLKPHSFDLHHMLEGLEEMFALRADQKGLDLDLTLDAAAPRYVRADEGKLRQVIMNLLGNAVKFTGAGRISLRVRPVAPPDGSTLGSPSQPVVWIEFAVTDTGAGIAPEELEHLFEPFVQTASGRQAQEGTGLGLPLSRQYVRLMGGEIEVQSAAGQGSTFRFAMPFALADASELERPPSTRQVVGLEPGQPLYRLLVVDDHEINRKLLHSIFEPVGFAVREAANGQEALAVWEEWAPHLIWMDMRMPVMDGFEATRRIKATTRGQATVIIALTASALEEDRAVILSEGCDDYIRKPFREADLFDALARHLGVRYVYRDIAPVTAPSAPALPPERLRDLAARLPAADPRWLAALERATVLGDQDAIIGLAEAVSASDAPLASGLTALARQFEHERILALIREARDKDQHADHPQT